MISVKIKGQAYSIASNIYEVDIHKLITAGGEREELAAISNIPLELCRQLDLDTFLPLIEFLNSPDDYITEEAECVSVSSESFEKFELAKKAIQDNDKLYRQVYEVCKVYYPDKKKSTDVFITGVNLINQISLFLEEFAELYEDGPDNNEVQAGIDKVNEMGAFGTVYVLAGKDVTKMDAVSEMPALQIYLAMLYNTRESKYQDALYKLKYPK